MDKKPNPKEIDELRAEGFYVAPVAGQGDERYAWGNSKTGARQEHTAQPPRRSQAQAWHDCQQYHDCEGPVPARPDWLDK